MIRSNSVLRLARPLGLSWSSIRPFNHNASVLPSTAHRHLSTCHSKALGPFPCNQWKQSRSQLGQRRIASFIPAYLVPPLAFVGLALTLWAYKCLMMIVFQGKIFYMPSVPPYSRREKIEDYVSQSGQIKWKQEVIRSLDGTQLALCIGEGNSIAEMEMGTHQKHVVLLYFHGYIIHQAAARLLLIAVRNASSIPPRLPALSTVLQSLCQKHQSSINYTLIALSYRGYWTSTGRPSQSGIEQDAAAAINYAHEYCSGKGIPTKLIIWGQSLGAGVASTAVANLLQGKFPQQIRPTPAIAALVLETPFTSVRNMLSTIYPQKWLPYRYLWPFLRSWWDTEIALRTIHEHGGNPSILCLVAEKDEVVTAQHGDDIVALCRKLNLNVERRVISNALHTEVMAKERGRTALRDFVRRVAAEK